MTPVLSGLRSQQNFVGCMRSIYFNHNPVLESLISEQAKFHGGALQHGCAGKFHRGALQHGCAGKFHRGALQHGCAGKLPRGALQHGYAGKFCGGALQP